MTDHDHRLEAPASKQAVEEFLEAAPEQTVYEIQYVADGEQRTRIVAALLADFSDLRPSAVPLDAPPSVRATIVTPADRTFEFMPIEALQSIAAVDPPDELFPVTATEPQQRAEQLERYASEVPSVVSVTDLTELLGSDDTNVVRSALAAVEQVADARPDDCIGLVPTLREIVADANDGRRRQALAALATLAAERPADIAPSVDVIAAQLDAADTVALLHAIQCLANVADEAAESIRPHAGAVAEVAASADANAAGYAVYVLNRLATLQPATVEPHVEALVGVLRREGMADVALMNAIAALGRVTKAYPGVAGDVVPDVEPLLASETVKLRANAAGLLADISMTDPAAVFPCTDVLVELLDDDDDYVRANATGSLARVMEADPDRLGDCIDRFVELLDDDHAVVRENACWALGYAGANQARSRLEAVSRDDPDEDVRGRAQWALAELERDGA